MLQKLLLLGALLFLFLSALPAQQSVARRWNEALLQSIRQDFARPPVHARNLFHTSMALYDGWAVYDTVAETYLLGKTVGNYTCPFTGVPVPADIKAAREEAMSFAAFRVLSARFVNSPNAFAAFTRFRDLMIALGYDYNNNDIDYTSGSPAALGNYLGQCVVQMGLQDGANEQNNYAIQYYQAVNPPLVMANAGDPTILDPNRWQPLTLVTAIDQNGNPIPSTQVFQSPEWGLVQPFAMTAADRTVYQRNGHHYWVYHDSNLIPFLDTIDGGGTSEEYKWNFQLVSAWSAQLDPTDGVMWDISPGGIGNVSTYPQNLAELHDFYNFTDGGDPGTGRAINPHTGAPYTPQIVPRGDYTRVLAQYWADGPTSETPPGHWFAILNYVGDNPDFVKRFNGKGPVLDDLEWDVKAYLTLGGAAHDAAVTAWGIKGWYDGTRPVSALRYMAGLGQSSDISLPSYHPAGVTLMPGLFELVEAGDTLAGPNNENVGKIKCYAWKGPGYVTDPLNQFAGVDWILAENWWPYQRKTFVTPPFAGYISGHSTYSRSAAEILTALTGDEYFPGGLGEFHIGANSNFLVLEKGPSVDVKLQWATYRDASDQTSLSRIWGGIHPPFDDIPGRLAGIQIAADAFAMAKDYFYNDNDLDGHYSYEDCDDANPLVFDGAPELCDGLDNNCNGLVDDNIPFYTFYADSDGDGFGNADSAVVSCISQVPGGYVANNQDCNDTHPAFNPGMPELCDGLDNNCNGLADDDIPFYTYYVDGDADGFGNADSALVICLSQIPDGYVTNNQDCDDSNPAFNPGMPELCDGLDNDCNGLADDDIPFYTYYIDIDGDGFGNTDTSVVSCLSQIPAGYAANNQDCDDANPAFNPGMPELCDGLDNDCNGEADDNIPYFVYYADIDDDGFGNQNLNIFSCLDVFPGGFVVNGLDCNDTNAAVNPGAVEIEDGLDNDCNGLVDDIVSTTELLLQTKVFPNPVQDLLTVYHTGNGLLRARLFNISGQTVKEESLFFSNNLTTLDLSGFVPGLYFLKIYDLESGREMLVKVIKT